jgi:hypothetical protein
MMKQIDLDHSVAVEGQTYAVLTMRRPKVKDQKAAQKMAKTADEQETLLFANLCDVPPAVIDELDMADYGELQRTYEGFLSRRPANSEKQPAS